MVKKSMIVLAVIAAIFLYMIIAGALTLPKALELAQLRPEDAAYNVGVTLAMILIGTIVSSISIVSMAIIYIRNR